MRIRKRAFCWTALEIYIPQSYRWILSSAVLPGTSNEQLNRVEGDSPAELSRVSSIDTPVRLNELEAREMAIKFGLEYRKP